MSSDQNLHVNDPVLVQSSDGNSDQLEGVVYFVGAVDFAASSNDGDGDGDSSSWVGVRLTGKSVGQGQNDGSVEGKRYFDCPADSGIFVRASSVTKKTLSKLEELRLRRELAASSVTSTSVIGGAKTPPRGEETGGTKSSSPARESTMGGTTTTAKTKLEELRLRREALKQAKQQHESSAAAAAAATAQASSLLGTRTPPRASTSSSPRLIATTASPTTSVPAAPVQGQEIIIDDLKRQLSDLTQQLKTKDNEAAKMQDKLSAAEQKMADQTERLEALQKSLEETAMLNRAAVVESSTKAVLAKSLEEVQEQNRQLLNETDELKGQLETARQELTRVHHQWTAEQKVSAAVVAELTSARAEVTAYQNQLQAVTDQNDQRGVSDAVHYKERAKLQADLSAWKRRVELLEKEKMELEATIEDVTLDKEQMQEEKEILEDKYEEIKLDAETAQMEVEELRMELEDAKAAVERVTGLDTDAARTTTVAAVPSLGSEQHGEDAAAFDMVQALQVQNLRLRDALIRLREQSALEKMELTRQLRSTEKDAEANTAVQKRVEELTDSKQNYEEQINDLKDMVEQGAAFESMVEDLSDRVMALEEVNVALQMVVRELEEASELTAEMEEVQADELKAMAIDLEGRDTIIRNMEEAIKMQRRREDDLRRTVGNYKISIETLRQEKQALLELQQGGAGETSSLVASSQKALARAVQLVADAADTRKREAQAVMDSIDHITYKHMSNRLECLLPHSVVSAELSAVKGELIASKVVCKASKTLAGILMSFRKSIRPPLPNNNGESDGAASFESLNLKLSDEVQQQVSTMLHQSEFACLIAEVSSELLRFLAAGQWPDLLSHESSTELGTVLGHAIPELDNALGVVLKSLKEEGALTVEQSNIGELQLTIQNTMQSLRTDIERENGVVVPSSWKPPGWAVLRDASVAKFLYFGAASALSLAVDAQSGNNVSFRALNGLYNKVEQCSAQASNACLRMANLNVRNEKLVDELIGMFADLATESKTLMDSVRDLLASAGDFRACEATTESNLRCLAKLALVLRAENLNPNEHENHHALSPETDDAWRGIAIITRSIREIDGDNEDVNYLLRARLIEHRLNDAIENEPKLAFTTTKVASLEKTMSSRLKEIAMQNARLSELEKLIAKSSSTPIARGKNFDFRSSEEYSNLQEENRVLTEAMDVLQREVEMYENEIRALKDFKSPKRGSTNNSRTTPRRATPSINDFSPNSRGATDDSQSTFSLEATLFRPALQQALQEAARWKASATAAAIMSLPPLPMPSVYNGDEYMSRIGDFSDDFIHLSSAITTSRIQKASVSMVDLTNRSKTPRVQLREMKARNEATSERLETIMLRFRGRIQ